MNGLTLVPTLNRIKLLKRFIKSLEDTNTTHTVWFLVDKSDWVQNNLAYKELDEHLEISKWKFVITDAVKMGDKIREVWPQVLEADPKWVNILNDDHVVKTDRWDEILDKRIDGTNFVTCWDNWMSPRKAAGATMFSMDLLKTVGFPIYPEGMKHLFIDDLWESIGKGTGIWDIDHSVCIEHHNQLKTPQERDSTFYEVYGRDQDLTKSELWKNDEAVYRKFMQTDFNEVRNKIRVLRGQAPINFQS